MDKYLFSCNSFVKGCGIGFEAYGNSCFSRQGLGTRKESARVKVERGLALEGTEHSGMGSRHIKGRLGEGLER